MGTCTAQILVGQGHPYDGGIINVSHTLLLSENGVAKWTLTGSNLFGTTNQDFKPITWIPTIEQMLEDAFLMIGIYVLKNKDLKEMIEPHLIDKNGYILLYEQIPSEKLQEMYKIAKKVEGQYKLVITGFYGSTILNQLSNIEQYPFEVEVCTPIYSREKSIWSNQMEIRGSF